MKKGPFGVLILRTGHPNSSQGHSDPKSGPQRGPFRVWEGPEGPELAGHPVSPSERHEAMKATQQANEDAATTATGKATRCSPNSWDRETVSAVEHERVQ